MGSSRIFLVPDVQSQRSHLRAVLDSVTAEKREGRARFFAEQGRRNLLPPLPPFFGIRGGGKRKQIRKRKEGG